jgi:hypothetical protein
MNAVIAPKPMLLKAEPRPGSYTAAAGLAWPTIHL